MPTKFHIHQSVCMKEKGLKVGGWNEGVVFTEPKQGGGEPLYYSMIAERARPLP